MTRRGIAIGVMALALATGLIASASAGVGQIEDEPLGSSNGLRYLVGSVPVAGGESQVRLQCEPTLAVGGGADYAGSPEQSLVNTSEPATSLLLGQLGDTWQAQIQSSASSAKPLRVYAICLTRRLNRLSYEETEVKLLKNDPASGRVECSGGASILSGGFGMDSGQVVRSVPVDDADSNELPDDGWRATGVTSDAGPNGLRVYAICLQGGGTSYRSDRGSVRDNRAKTLRATCPRSKSVAGGGFSIGGPAASSFAHSLRPRDSRSDRKKVPDDHYQATLVNGTDARVKASVWAVCLG